MERIRVDVIIPIYNQSKFLPYCLSSILSQSISSLIDVTIIDDNSTDDYSDTITYFKEFLNISVLKLSTNQGPGYARQIGIDITHNPYLMFIDADDVFQNIFAVEFLVGLMQLKEEPCAVFSSFCEEGKNNIKSIHVKDNTWLFGKIYRRSFIQENGIRFNNSRANEDKGFNCQVILCSQKDGSRAIKMVDRITYCWKWNEDSITRRNNFEYKGKDIEGFVDNTLHAIEIARKANVPEPPINRQSTLTMLYLYFKYLENQKTNDYDIEFFLKKAKDFYFSSFAREGLSSESREFLVCMATQYKSFLARKIIDDKDIQKLSFIQFLDLLK